MLPTPRKFGTLSRLILWRLSAVVLVQTAHVPDEYWQSLEVAHRAAFGYGHLTWEWAAMIRSYAYPFLISILYRTLAMFSLDFAWLLTTLPRVFQAVLVAYADYRFYQWTKSKWMLLVLCLNWYWYYCATRTLINTIETVGTTIALTMFPWKDSHVQSVKFLWIVGPLCMARPTAAIMWLPLCAYHVCASAGKRAALLSRYAAIGFTCFAICTLIDSACYGTLVITPWRFFQVNVLGSVGDAYGRQHALWYILIGLPVLLGPYYIPFVFAAWQILRHSVHFQRETLMLAVIGWTLTVYSLLSHKEFRFVLPLLPLFVCTSSACTYRLKVRITEYTRKSVLALLVLGNLGPGLYFSLVHQRGTLDAMAILRDELLSQASPSQPTDTLILTPCHATPLYSHLHVNASVRFLTCEPNRNNSADYVDEADRFFADPPAWLDDNYVNGGSALPTHVMAFDNVASKIAKFLRTYKLIAKVFHTHFPESNYGRYVLLYKHATLN